MSLPLTSLPPFPPLSTPPPPLSPPFHPYSLLLHLYIPSILPLPPLLYSSTPLLQLSMKKHHDYLTEGADEKGGTLKMPAPNAAGTVRASRRKPGAASRNAPSVRAIECS
jgi:hypothetical protein